MSGQNVVPSLVTSVHPSRKCPKTPLCDVMILKLNWRYFWTNKYFFHFLGRYRREFLLSWMLNMSGQNVEPFVGTSTHPARKYHKKVLCDVTILKIEIDVTLEPIHIFFTFLGVLDVYFFFILDAKYERRKRRKNSGHQCPSSTSRSDFLTENLCLWRHNS